MSKLNRLLSCMIVGAVAISSIAIGTNAVDMSISKNFYDDHNSEKMPSNESIIFDSLPSTSVSSTVAVNEVVSVDSTAWTETILDEESYATLLVEKSGMDADSARSLAQETFLELERENSKNRSARKVVTTVSQTYYPSGCKSYGIGIEYGFYAYKSSGSTSVYEKVWSPWAIAAGSGPHTYVGGGVSAEVSSGSVYFNANGNLEVAVQKSYSVEGNISSGTLVNIGFSSSYTVGITTYDRRYISYSKTFTGGW